jgi:histidinol-phosphate aminotransferase
VSSVLDSSAALVAEWVRPEIRGLTAYHVPDATGLIKLDAMENPYPWPGVLGEAWRATLKSVDLNRYPDPQARALKEALRHSMAVPESMELLLGNGSDELLQIILLAVGSPGRSVVVPAPTFAMYRLISIVAGLDYHEVPLRPDFALDAPAVLAAIEAQRPAVVFLSYPNNPTGNLFDVDALHAIIRASPGLVVLDEAYHAFAEETLMGSLAQYPNLLVLRTLSKLGLAGLRLGILVGPRRWISELEKARLPYNINTLTQVSAAFALQHGELLEAQARAIRAERQRLHSAMAAIPGLEVFPSRANFLLFRGPSAQAPRLFASLRAAGVLVKDVSASHALLADCLRVTVGTPEENETFLGALSRALRDG